MVDLLKIINIDYILNINIHVDHELFITLRKKINIALDASINVQGITMSLV